MEQHTPEKWKAETKSYPLGDTGDYDAWVELSNGNIVLSTSEADEDEVQEIADTLNALSGIPDPAKWVEDAKLLKKEKDEALETLLNELNEYRKQLFEDSRVSAKKFEHMQTAIHGAKVLIHNMRGTTMSTEERTAWVK